MLIPIEDVQETDTIHGKRVASILHRDSVGYVRIVLEGGRDIVDGYRRRDTVEVERSERRK